MAIRGKVIEPDGRTVVLTDETWAYICGGHLDMTPYERAIMETLTHPDDRTMDIRPGRERYYAQGRGPTRWLRVVVEFVGEEGRVVTAFGHSDEPS